MEAALKDVKRPFLCAVFLPGSCAEQTGASVRRRLGPWAGSVPPTLVPAHRHASPGLWLRRPPRGPARLSGAPIHLDSCCRPLTLPLVPQGGSAASSLLWPQGDRLLPPKQGGFVRGGPWCPQVAGSLLRSGVHGGSLGAPNWGGAPLCSTLSGSL